MNYSLTRKTNPPQRGHESDAGIDIFIPYFEPQFMQSLKQFNSQDDYNILPNGQLWVLPHRRIRIPTGVHFNIPKNHMLVGLQKSSYPYNTGFVLAARVVDQGYQGQYFGVMINTMDKPSQIKPCVKFVQLILTPISCDKKLYNMPIDELYQSQSDRGSGAFGSTGV